MPPSHSPLPPDLPVTLEILNAKVEHLIDVVEYVKGRTETYDDRVEELRTLARNLHKTSLNLASTTLRLKPASWSARIATMGGGAVLGGALIQLIFVELPKLIGH